MNEEHRPIRAIRRFGPRLAMISTIQSTSSWTKNSIHDRTISFLEHQHNELQSCN